MSAGDSIATKPAKPPKPSYKGFPKRHDGFRHVYYKDKLREQYLESPFFSWAEFCESKGYNPCPKKRHEFPFKSWHAQKITLQVQTVEESLTGQAIDVKTMVAKERLKFPKTWNEEATNTLRLVQFMERRLSLFAKWDMDHEQEIIAGLIKPKFEAKTSDLVALAMAKKTLQSLHQGALLMPPGDLYTAVIPIRDTDPEALEAEAEGDRLRDIDTKVLGCGALDQQSITQMLNKWIDQQASLEAPSEEEIVIPENSPLTPLLEDDDTT